MRFVNPIYSYSQSITNLINNDSIHVFKWCEWDVSLSKLNRVINQMFLLNEKYMLRFAVVEF